MFWIIFYVIIFAGTELIAADAGQVPDNVWWDHHKKYPFKNNVRLWDIAIIEQLIFCNLYQTRHLVHCQMY